MLRITIDIIPFGIVEQRKTLYEIDIMNTGRGTHEKGQYVADIKGQEKNKSVEIKYFDRIQKYGALKLLKKVINQYIKEQ